MASGLSGSDWLTVAMIVVAIGLLVWMSAVWNTTPPREDVTGLWYIAAAFALLAIMNASDGHWLRAIAQVLLVTCGGLQIVKFRMKRATRS